MFNLSNSSKLFCLLPLMIALIPVSSLAQRAPGAVDDVRLVGLRDQVVVVKHYELLENDLNSARGAVTIVREPHHGEREVPAGGDPQTEVRYIPGDTFWAVGSDSVTYRIDTPQGSSTANLVFVAKRSEGNGTAPILFEQTSDPFADLTCYPF